MAGKVIHLSEDAWDGLTRLRSMQRRTRGAIVETLVRDEIARKAQPVRSPHDGDGIEHDKAAYGYALIRLDAS